MTKDEYVNGYATLNKCYNQIFDTLQSLMDQGFDDTDIITAFNYGLNAMDKGLDVYKDKYVDNYKEPNFQVESGYGCDDTQDNADESGKKDKKDKFKGFKVFGGK